ncbi:MAG: HNH endonuclease [Planctomycetota bacterium]
MTDTATRFEDGIWRTPCLHCRSKLLLAEDGEDLNGATREQVVPQCWVEKRSAVDLIQGLTGPDDPCNLALACARCYQGKGARHDATGPNHPRAREVVTQSKQRRMERWKPVKKASDHDACQDMQFGKERYDLRE